MCNMCPSYGRKHRKCSGSVTERYAHARTSTHLTWHLICGNIILVSRLLGWLLLGRRVLRWLLTVERRLLLLVVVQLLELALVRLPSFRLEL